MHDPIEDYCRQTGLHIALAEGLTPTDQEFQIHWAVPVYYSDTDILLPRQGFKLHVSGTMSNALTTFRLAVPHLLSKRVSFKCVPSLVEIERMNRGVYGLSQIGKLITVYPRSDREAIEVAQQLLKLLNGQSGPSIPSDRQISPEAPVFYRYGVMAPGADEPQEVRNMLLGPDRTWLPDDRSGKLIVPNWVDDIFSSLINIPHSPVQTLLESDHYRYIVLTAIQRRGGGGVFEALQTHRFERTVRQVALKAGFRFGEVNIHGVSSIERLKWQYDVLMVFRGEQWCADCFDYFETSLGSAVAMELLDAKSWGHALLHEGKQRGNLTRTVGRFKLLAGAMIDLHAQNYYLCDLSFDNVLVKSGSDHVYIVDLESCWHSTRPWYGLSGTPGYHRDSPHDALQRDAANSELGMRNRDIHSLGCMLSLLARPHLYAEFLAACVSARHPESFHEWWSRQQSKIPCDRQFLDVLGQRCRETPELVDLEEMRAGLTA